MNGPWLPWRSALVLAGAVGLASVIALIWGWSSLDRDDESALIVLAPSSLAPVQDALDAALEAELGEAPQWNFSGSQSIVAQIADGAPVDVIVTADELSYLAARAASAGRFEFRTELTLAENHLVLAVAAGNPGGVDGLATLDDPDPLIGVCAPVVPCGRLAATAMAGLGAEIDADTEETSVRALTAKLVSGELDAGLVYRTDARAAGLDVIAVDGLDAFTNTYWGGANDRGRAVLDFLASDEGQAILRAAGFGS
ncbi:MAG: substrate-binding domain-containing protein [Actinomycetota bacterium]